MSLQQIMAEANKKDSIADNKTKVNDHYDFEDTKPSFNNDDDEHQQENDRKSFYQSLLRWCSLQSIAARETEILLKNIESSSVMIPTIMNEMKIEEGSRYSDQVVDNLLRSMLNRIPKPLASPPAPLLSAPADESSEVAVSASANNAMTSSRRHASSFVDADNSLLASISDCNRFSTQIEILIEKEKIKLEMIDQMISSNFANGAGIDIIKLRKMIHLFKNNDDDAVLSNAVVTANNKKSSSSLSEDILPVVYNLMSSISSKFKNEKNEINEKLIMQIEKIFDNIINKNMAADKNNNTEDGNKRLSISSLSSLTSVSRDLNTRKSVTSGKTKTGQMTEAAWSSTADAVDTSFNDQQRPFVEVSALTETNTADAAAESEPSNKLLLPPPSIKYRRVIFAEKKKLKLILKNLENLK
jgi:hypothetical protein